MSIPISQPFIFEGNLPNFDRDVINSSLFESQDPLNLTTSEGTAVAEKYDVGHIVWDINTRHHYIVESKTVSDGYIIGKFRLKGPVTKTCQEWYNLGDNYIPAFGEVIVFNDYKTVNSKNVPTFKVGDGKTNAANLPFATTDYVENAGTSNVAKQLEHKLTIGDQEFDGSADVEIEKYRGENEIR